MQFRTDNVWPLFEHPEYAEIKGILATGTNIHILEGRRRIGKTFSIARAISELQGARKIFYANVTEGLQSAFQLKKKIILSSVTFI